MEPSRYVVKFSFEGHRFEGYARQRCGHTVEGEVIDGLVRAGLVRGAREAGFASASRVDRGVSAMGAAIAFDTKAPRDRILRSLNANCPSIVAHSISDVPSGFDPRHQADSRWYRYHYIGTDPGTPLDVASMRKAARAFIGEHDYSAFARLDGRDPLRTVQRISIDRAQGSVVFDVWGQSFLWNQVRRMATAILRVGQREVGPDAIAMALEEGRSSSSFPPAPVDGLFLMDVVFKGLKFDGATTFPKGTVRSVHEGHRRGLCTVKFHEYLLERTRL
jgi:tRNA pseudouridine38-40 synthase